MINNKENEIKKENLFLAILRILLGLVFILSSVMKGIDPLGTAYRVEDYLAAYNMLWLHGAELAISYLLIGVEFLIGISLVLKLRAGLAAFGVLLLMIFFTTITYFDATYNLVPDCGCFGDAVKLTAWETFYKNVVLIVLAAIVFFGRKRFRIGLPAWFQTILLIIFAGGYIWFMSYNYSHLPMLDFREWKVGNDMKSENVDAAVTYLIYENKETGELKEYISPDYPWNDSVWMSEWQFVNQRIDETGVVRKHNLVIQDEEGTDVTRELIENPEYQFLLVSYDLDGAYGDAMINTSELLETFGQLPVDFALLTASGPDIVAKYQAVYKINYPAYFTDGTDLKAMIRSNPGLILLKDGFVIDKWHYNDFPATWKEAVSGD